MDWSWLLYLMCPLMMLPMIYFMMKGNHGCGNHNHRSHAKEHGQHDEYGELHNNHKWMMITCCILPIVLATGYFIAKETGVAISNWFPLLLILICPLSHLLMMRRMNRKKS